MTTKQEMYQEFADDHTRQADYYKKESSYSGSLTFIGGFACTLATVGFVKEVVTGTEDFVSYGGFGALALLMAGITGYEFKDYLDSRKQAKTQTSISAELQKLANEQ